MEDKCEMHNPFWCPAHGFAHGERLADHRPGCVLERPDHPRAGPVAPLRMQAPEVDAREKESPMRPVSYPAPKALSQTSRGLQERNTALIARGDPGAGH